VISARTPAFTSWSGSESGADTELLASGFYDRVGLMPTGSAKSAMSAQDKVPPPNEFSNEAVGQAVEPESDTFAYPWRIMGLHWWTVFGEMLTW
jgi:hypothetical protein